MYKIAIIGNPNTGKTSIFNYITGLSKKVSNYSGVTVEICKGLFRFGWKLDPPIEIIDTPGVSSLDKIDSLDAQITKKIIQGETDTLPDAILIVVDSTNLRKNLFLVQEVLSLGRPCLVVLNMEDELTARRGVIDKDLLAKKLQVPVISVSLLKGWGLRILNKYIREKLFVAPKNMQQRTSTQLQTEAENICNDVYKRKIDSDKVSDRIDSVLLHPLWGGVIFLGILVVIFQSVFSWAAPLQEGIEFLFSALGDLVRAVVPHSKFQEFLIEGVLTGISGVLVFLPQIVILLSYIALLETTGYMPRTIFLTDRWMSFFGLEGGSFLPLLSSYACAVPSILATRTICDSKTRLVTIMISPFMTCSARLPVYTLLVSACVPNIAFLGGIIGLRTLVMASLYFSAVFVAFFTSFFLSWILGCSGASSNFIQELPPYRRPTFRNFFLYVWMRSLIFVKKVFTIILLTTILLWFFTAYPADLVKEGGINASYAASIGKIFEPIMSPLGFDWKICIGLLTSLAAREVMVATLATIYNIDEEDSLSLSNVISQNITLPQAISLLFFFVFALQCFSTLAVIKKETGSWQWTIGILVYMWILAYGFSFVMYRATTWLCI